MGNEWPDTPRSQRPKKQKRTGSSGRGEVGLNVVAWLLLAVPLLAVGYAVGAILVGLA